MDFNQMTDGLTELLTFAAIGIVAVGLAIFVGIPLGAWWLLSHLTVSIH